MTSTPVLRDDTIVALSTAPGKGAIALVRLSGAQALAVARRVSTPVPATARRATLAAFHAADDVAQVIDRGVITWYAAPRSYTGEDVVELAVHGGPLVSTLLVAACVAAGARPALPGEFTERAVLHGKMDLVQAEAVADLIDARSRAAHRAAVQQLDGALSRRLTTLRDAMLHLDAMIAYDIDFPEEDDGAIPRERVIAGCDEALRQLDALLATLPAAALGRDGALVVLAGPPNAGKSSLLNALVGEARVLVSEIPGTTRDAVEVLLDETPYPWRLVDTAGLRESGDALERMGIEVSERFVAQAHVVLACAETPDVLAALVPALQARTSGVVLAVRTKADCGGLLPRRGDGREGGAKELAVSATAGSGLVHLRRAINAAISGHLAAIDVDTPLVTRARHELALRTAQSELHAFRDAWETDALPAPVAATHLRAAVTALESLIGAVDVEDVLDRVFRSFCVGK